ncbi:MAG: protein phosphatase 2C domain-containing protein [Verrucomicrobiota bacterium]
MNLQCCGITDVGKHRSSNEDAFLIIALDGQSVVPDALPVRTELSAQVPVEGMLLVVSDGIGGSNAGEVASSIAVNTLYGGLRDASQTEDVVPFLSGVIRQADAAVRDASSKTPECAGMGATLTALWMRPSGAALAHAGDSRLYRFRNEVLSQLSTEHSPVGRMRANGEITEEQARNHRLKHLIDQSLGGPEELFAPEIVPVELASGDVYLICSDGLTDAVADSEIQAVMKQVVEGATVPSEGAAFLIQTANEVYGKDNLTVVIAYIR